MKQISLADNHGMAFWACALATTLFGSCGDYPNQLKSSSSLDHTSADARSINIADLPIESYPSLSKFQAVQHISFFRKSRSGANDRKLLALAKINLPNLEDIDLLNCPLVTDDGLAALKVFPSLKYLQLEGTSITDAGVIEISKLDSLRGINVANCEKVSSVGVATLAAMDHLQELSFSVESWQSGELISIINGLQSVTWCSIVDTSGILLSDKAVIEAVENSNVKILLQDKGAIQEMRDRIEKRR